MVRGDAVTRETPRRVLGLAIMFGAMSFELSDTTRNNPIAAYFIGVAVGVAMCLIVWPRCYDDD